MSYRSSFVIAETPTHPPSSIGRTSSIVQPAPHRRFKSARLIGEYEKPWLEKWSKSGSGKKISYRAWDSIIFWVSIFVGFALGALMCYFAYTGVVNLEYCLIMDDEFSNINSEFWSYEIQRGGFGTGSFEWTTDDPLNSFTDAEGLHISPTLTLNSTNITLAEMYDGYTVNLTTAGTCTSPDPFDSCSIYSNRTAGAIINPVRSARLTTKGKKTVKYGRVEVVARMPKGDWLWPAIWMMPEDSVYGAWPASGEIDLAESKGNDPANYPTGRDSVISALHWGPISEVDAFYKTNGKHNVRRKDYSQDFYTYGLEWNENYLFTYINNRLLQVFFIKFATGPKNMWERGNFGQDIVNNSALHDPWSQTGNRNTPFDQAFYLILNVAVGGTNGYFPDQVGNKPWGDKSPIAQLQFFNATAQWAPTWGDSVERSLTVKSVKMWTQGACGSA